MYLAKFYRKSEGRMSTFTPEKSRSLKQCLKLFDFDENILQYNFIGCPALSSLLSFASELWNPI